MMLMQLLLMICLLEKEHCNLKAKYVKDFKEMLLDCQEKFEVIYHLAAEARIQPLKILST